MLLEFLLVLLLPEVRLDGKKTPVPGLEGDDPRGLEPNGLDPNGLLDATGCDGCIANPLWWLW